MSIVNIFRPSHSIVSHFTWRIILATIISLILILGVILSIVYLVGAFVLGGLYDTSINVTNEKINNIFCNVEIAVKNNVPEAKQDIKDNSLHYFAVENLIRLNDNIIGTAIAYNPDCEPKRGELYAPYAYRDSTGIHFKQLNSSSYNYPEKEWYKKPVKFKKDFWSEPYIDKGGGDIPMITYSLPLFNNEGEVFAIHTADMSLDWIEEVRAKTDSVFNTSHYMTLEDNSIGHAYSFIVTRQGSFVAHPDKSLTFQSTLKDYFKDIAPKDKRNLAENILTIEDEDGEFGLFRGANDKIFIVFYTPLERTNWVMAVILPITDILGPLNSFFTFFGILILIGLAIIALVCYSTVKSVTKPIRMFADSADEIAKGNFLTELPEVKSKDEMFRLRNSFESMKQSLVKQIEETKAVNEEKGRMEGELQTARAIQMSMLPKQFPPFPERNDLDVFAQLTPAKEVGGDLYDFYIRDEKLFFCIGDVSGKGVPAALVMAVTRGLFRSFSARESNPAKIIANINDAITQRNETEMFVTFFLGILDLPSGRLHYCNAAHCPPILFGKEMGLLPIIPNVPLGIIPKFKFQSQETKLTTNTIIFAYTDGLTEATDSAPALYGEERMLQVAEQLHKQSFITPKEVLHEIENSVKEFVGSAEQSDDLTMLCIQYLRLQRDIKLKRSLTLPNDIETIPQLNIFIDQAAEDAPLPPDLSMSLNLAIEEAVVNVMSYAYPRGTHGDVIIDLSVTDQQLTIAIIDQGMPFDPTSQVEADTSLSVEDRPIGGLGIYLVRQLMDSINYERIDGKNVLTLIKKLT